MSNYSVAVKENIFKKSSFCVADGKMVNVVRKVIAEEQILREGVGG